MNKKFYSTYHEAKKAAQFLKITTFKEYTTRYKEDPLLPASPYVSYSEEWTSFPEFLRDEKKNFYNTYEEASQAAQELGYKTSSDYFSLYKEDTRLSGAPHYYYSGFWKGWPHFLGLRTEEAYVTYEEASTAVQSLGITTEKEYKKRFIEDPKLPRTPRLKYKKKWISFSEFTGTNKGFYSTYDEASNAALKLGITTSKEYRQRYKEDSLLPVTPNIFYNKDWLNWFKFLGKDNKTFYPSIEEAIAASKSLGIYNSKEYTLRYKEDPRLPSNPKIIYKNERFSWALFFGENAKKNYSKYYEASEASVLLGISSFAEYNRRYKEDYLLPCNPKITYKKHWKDWSSFLEYQKEPNFLSFKEASKTAKLLCIRTSKEYNKRYKEVHMLPAKPSHIYGNEWISWSNFLGREELTRYKTYNEASLATQALRIASASQYSEHYKKDPLLPSVPYRFYGKEWKSWTDFLLPEVINNLGSFKQACKALEIKNSQVYREFRKKYPQLPAKPEKKYSDWVDWYDALEIPRPYPYDQLREIVKSSRCKTLVDYNDLRIASKDPCIPVKPESVYKESGWTNTFDFFGKPRPYQTNYFTEEWELWKLQIEEFLKYARGGESKAKDLCKFVREYIEPNNFENCPLEYLTRGTTDIQPMLDILSTESITHKKKWLFSINEFINWVITECLTLEDDETGEIIRVKNAKNPFAYINFDAEVVSKVANETNKLALPYQYVKSGRNWIFPENSIMDNLTYSDLNHLHKFNGDWAEVKDLSTLDLSDPDCITKIENNKTKIWVPTYWTYTYALMELPARGRQIVYCDSGEADKYTADFVNGKVIWVSNPSKLAGQTKDQGMISKSGESEFGVHYTSNKTQIDGKGYTIPFMPDGLAYWLIKLRKWQEKYNPITEPTKWTDLKRTNLNEIQKKHKGSNCFLFRDIGGLEPGTFGTRLAQRLAATLFFGEKDNASNATYKGQVYAECKDDLESSCLFISNFSSQYTPHSMRVSLINAYAFEFGLPIEVIMKLVGHSSIAMTIYYTKSDVTGANIRSKLEKGEKEALKNAPDKLKSFIEQQRIEECRSQLVGSSTEFIKSLDNSRPASSYLFKDFGICPVGGAFCGEGGAAVAAKVNIYHPVPAGYLGEQNCIKCRFFVTGPAFMMGLTAVFNEISLTVNVQSRRYAELESELVETAKKIDVISHQIYENKITEKISDKLLYEKNELNYQRQKINSEIETKAKKLDLFMTDLNRIHEHLLNCKKVVKYLPQKGDKTLQLIVPAQFDIDLEFNLDEVSGFQQLSEVCENAELYHSCSDEMAVTRRSQIIDKMLLHNNIKPKMFLLNEQEQLIVGNQLTQLMLTRLKSWENLDNLIDGILLLDDLSDNSQFIKAKINKLFEQSTSLELGG